MSKYILPKAIIKIKVEKKIKPIPFTKRKIVPLKIGNDYYVSFGNNLAYPCRLLEIFENEEIKRIRIGIKTKYDKNNLESFSKQHILFADEIGQSPGEAIINEVTL
jgi:hypothetical protein